MTWMFDMGRDRGKNNPPCDGPYVTGKMVVVSTEGGNGYSLRRKIRCSVLAILSLN